MALSSGVCLRGPQKISSRKEADAFAADIVQRLGDDEEVVEALGRDVFVGVVVPRRFEGDE